MPNIPISKDGSLEPHNCFCPICGEDTNSLTIGVLMKAELPNGQHTYANRGETIRANRALANQGVIRQGERLYWDHVPDGERVQDTEPCQKCRDNFLEQKKIVEAGGIYFKCAGCSVTGAILADHALSKAVRKNTGIDAPYPVGFEFQSCDEHSGATNLADKSDATHH